MFTIYFPNLKLPNIFIGNHSRNVNKFRRNFLQSYRYYKSRIINYLNLRYSLSHLSRFYRGAYSKIDSKISRTDAWMSPIQDTRLRNRGSELEDDQRLVSRATSVFATRLNVLIVFPSPSFSTHPHGSFQVSPSTPFSPCYRARWKRYTVSRVYSEVNIQRVPSEDKGTGFAVNREMTTLLTLSKWIFLSINAMKYIILKY